MIGHLIAGQQCIALSQRHCLAQSNCTGSAGAHASVVLQARDLATVAEVPDGADDEHATHGMTPEQKKQKELVDMAGGSDAEFEQLLSEVGTLPLPTLMHSWKAGYCSTPLHRRSLCCCP